MSDQTDLRWHISSYSGSDAGTCVEVALTDATVHVRDTKDREIPGMKASATAWSGFLGSLC